MKGKSGFIVWRYKLRRDDTIPAPWTKAGKERIESLGLEMQVFIIICMFILFDDVIISVCDFIIVKNFTIVQLWNQFFLLIFQVPEGYEDKLEAVQDNKQSTGKNPKENGKKSIGRGKRSAKQSDIKLLCDSLPSTSKKAKVKYEIEKEVAILIKKDVENAKLWSTCKGAAEQGKQVIIIYL